MKKKTLCGEKLGDQKIGEDRRNVIGREQQSAGKVLQERKWSNEKRRDKRKSDRKTKEQAEKGSQRRVRAKEALMIRVTEGRDKMTKLREKAKRDDEQ